MQLFASACEMRGEDVLRQFANTGRESIIYIQLGVFPLAMALYDSNAPEVASM